MSARETPALVACCWTSAGDAQPAGPGHPATERSPLPLPERVRAVARSGWAGLGLLHADLLDVDLAALGRLVAAEGITHVEVELLEAWWGEEAAWRPRWELLLDAARQLGAAYVKATAPPPGHGSDLVARLGVLAAEAEAAGTRLGLEPVPWSGLATLPAGAGVVRAVDHPALGLVVDAWHVFRAGTTPDELAASLTPGLVVAVELDDADADVVGSLFEDTRDRRRYCGEGSFDLPGLVRVLRESGFEGPWGVEALSAEHRALPLGEGLVRARDAALAVLLDPASHPRPPEASP